MNHAMTKPKWTKEKERVYRAALELFDNCGQPGERYKQYWPREMRLWRVCAAALRAEKRKRHG